ncbi:hypothetical protein U9M48_020463 [Paspalum notatum var. saurae]|uniref:Late embryogenesis abundant protein LEA-2 subgroup domain-containing protein n=1 Tax=Paspalum notatum var. saurae TaxID=547442 RepID=A0AAQ3WSA1_PASNO
MHQPAGRRAAAADPRPPPPGHYATAGRPFFRQPGDYPAAPAPPPGRPFSRPPGPPGRGRHHPDPDPDPAPDAEAARPSPITVPLPPDRPSPGPFPGPGPSALLPPPPRRRSSALASCLAATAFLVLSAGGAGAALFLLFRPRAPDIAVAAVRLPAFAAANGTVAFTLQQTAAVRNPNRSPLAHFDSSLRVAYAGGELGPAVYIPAGRIDGGRTKDMSASFDVPAIPVPPAAAQPLQVGVGGAVAAQDEQQQQTPTPPAVIEVDSLLVVKGRVTVLRVLTHRVQAAKVCRVGVSPLDGRVVGVRC